MHAHIDQLLSLRDGEPLDATVRAHVEGCGLCANSLRQLERQTQALRELPPFVPPAVDFAAVQMRATSQVARRSRGSRWAVAAAVVCGMIGLLVAMRDHSSGPFAPTARSRTPAVQLTTDAQQLAATDQHPVAQLVAQSRELDELLQQLPPPRQVQRVSFAATVDRLEQRVQWIDMQLLAVADANPQGPELEHQLWRERVNLMDSLVKVRYAESLPQSF